MHTRTLSPLLLIALLLAVSACGPKYVGQAVDVQRAKAVPLVLKVGEKGKAYFPLEHFDFSYTITRTGETDYALFGMAFPTDNSKDSWVSHGNFYLLFVKDGIVVGQHNFGPDYRTDDGFVFRSNFESQEFDHVLAHYHVTVKQPRSH